MEAREASDVITGMFSFLILSKLFYGMLMFIILIGTFLVNSLPAPVLFDSGASRLFVSRPSSRSFGMTLGEIEFFSRFYLRYF